MIRNKKLFIISELVFVVLMLSVLVSAQVIDTDKDGIADQKDNCPYKYNPKQEDVDNDGVGDVCDNCPTTYNPDQKDSDKDGIGDACEVVQDTDKDGIPDDKDNCPLIYNPDQKDANKNGRGDACEDSDGDGVMDDKDNCPLAYNPKQEDSDKDGIGDVCEQVIDSDKDGIPDEKDKCPNEPETFNKYQDEDGCPDSLPEIKPEAKPEIKPEVKVEVEKETEPPKISLTLTPPQPKVGERTKIKVKALDESPIREIAIFLNEKLVKKCPQTDYCQTEFVFMMGPEIYAAAIDLHNNVSARDITGRDFSPDINDNDRDGVYNSFDNCRNISNPYQQDSDNDGVGNACDECDPIKMERVTDRENFLLELQDFYIDNIGCGIRDTDSGLSYFTPGEIRKQKKDTDVFCQEIRTGAGSMQICGEGIKTEATDSCLNLSQVREYYIVNSSTGEFSYRDFNCPYGCHQDDQDGACICMGSDSDGGRNYYHQGCFTGTDCSLRENQEYCLNDHQLLERYREIRINERGEAFCAADVETYNCSIGCRDGTCICEDSDGGANYNVRGHVGRAGMDYCEDDNRTLVEYQVMMAYDYRSQQNTCFISSREHRCKGRCSEGRCLPPTCDDGIQNQGEANIDCGGPCSIACNQIRISGRILYEEADAIPNSNISRGFKPVRLANIKLGSSTGRTDNNGYFSFVISRRPGTRYKLEVRPTNYAARVERDYDACNEYVWWVKDGISIPETGNVNLGDLKIGINTNIDFSGYWQEPEHSCVYLFGIKVGCFCGSGVHNNNGGSAYFNIAETILLTREYANANRADSDSIGQVDVAYPDPTIHGLPWTDPFWGEIYLPKFYGGRDLGFLDVIIIHEYAHHLTEEISENDWALSEHTLCSEIDEEFAWFEGFAHYLSLFLANRYKNPSLFPERFLSQETTFYNFAESPDCEIRNLNVEGVILAGLWDMVDNPGRIYPAPPAYPESVREVFDKINGEDALIFRIFDTEMDNIVDAPDICEFIHGENGVERILEDSPRRRDAILRIFRENNIICP